MSSVSNTKSERAKQADEIRSQKEEYQRREVEAAKRKAKEISQLKA